MNKTKNKLLWASAQYEQPKDDAASDDENLLDFENVELEKELNEGEGGDPNLLTGGSPPKEGEKKPAGGDKK